jgi:hypothetical protein
MGITGYEMVATEVWAHKHINHSNKIQRDATHRLENHGSLAIWLTAFLLSHGPRRLFFMTAFSRGDGRNFSHNWKRHLFQPQGGSRYESWWVITMEIVRILSWNMGFSQQISWSNLREIHDGHVWGVGSNPGNCDDYFMWMDQDHRPIEFP